ncbi:MAG: carotenoid biosynthesis protein [Thermoplasmata archaeon]|nr:MAG: carotenoid biosynthesis protein [Thermoplasmata archaeon]
MEAHRFLRDWLPLIIIYVIYGVGTVSHVNEGTRELMLAMTPGVLLFMGLFVMHPDFLDRNWRLLLWALGIYIMTFTLEATGVATGLVFGDYEYGDTLGWKALAVPVVIGFNWVLVVLGALTLTKRIVSGPLQVAVFTGALTTAFDFVMEPVAIALDYWTWTAVMPPLHNFVAWFVISFGVALTYEYLKLETRNTLYIHYFLVQLVFFAVLNAVV